MKNLILASAIVLSIVSCNKKEEIKDKATTKTDTVEKVNVAPTEKAEALKTAYVDTSDLMKDYQEAKDIEAKYKAKANIAQKKLEGEAAKFKADAQNFQKNAQANGQEWAQKNGQVLQQREQELQMMQQQMLEDLQVKSDKERETVVNAVKKFIKDYGKENGYSYIYGTGQPATVLYAEDKYDITKEILDLLNENYKNRAKK
jgi:outer membrane protein